MAAPARLPTTPPTTTPVEGVEEFEVPLPEAAVLDDALPEATPVPPAAYPPGPVDVASLLERVAEYRDEVELSVKSSEDELEDVR